MLRSIAPEVKGNEVAVQNRELVFSNVEVEMENKKKSKSKYTHYKALFNLNKSLMLKSIDENSQPNLREDSTKPNTARNLGSSSSRGRMTSSSTNRRNHFS